MLAFEAKVKGTAPPAPGEVPRDPPDPTQTATILAAPPARSTAKAPPKAGPMVAVCVGPLVGLWVPRQALGSQRGNPRKIGKGLKNRVGVEKIGSPGT